MASPKPNIDDIYFAALEKAAGDERTAYLADACGADEELRMRVERLLQAQPNVASFLESPASGITPPPTIDQPPLEKLGAQIGPYKLLQEIGQGGMGVVYMAEQFEPIRRKVAIKIIKPGMDTAQVIARFEAERQALSLMDHPNIAKVLDAGTTSTGRPFFVMEVVQGQPISEYCDQRRLAPRQRIELFLAVCQAIQHAHQKGVIHRDIKPSNVLVTEYDGRPVAKVIDFGVAKAVSQPLTEKTMFTGLGQIVGTLEYMSPEQARVNQLDVDTRSDIYSLGVLLYELLTGSTPFDKQRLRSAAWDEMLRIIREEEPPQPSTRLSQSKDSLPSISALRQTEPIKLTKLVRGELDWIVMRALEKDRNRRYATASNLSADIERFLRDEPVQARPPSTWYRLKKFTHRHKRSLATTALVAALLISTCGVVVWRAIERATQRAEADRKIAATKLSVAQCLDNAVTARAELHALLRNPGELRRLLDEPARWKLALIAVQAQLERAKALANGIDITADLAARTARLKAEAEIDELDLHFATRLDEIRALAATTVEGKFAYEEARRLYHTTFCDMRLDVRLEQEVELAARISQSAIKEQIVAALDHWAWLSRRDPEHCRLLLSVARRTDPDPWRQRIRDPQVFSRPDGITPLADEALSDSSQWARLSPHSLAMVGNLLFGFDDNPAHDYHLVSTPATERGIAWFRKAQSRYPADFWINFYLGTHLRESEPGEAVGFLRAAIAIRPGCASVYNNLGAIFIHQNQIPDAIDAFQRGLDCDSRSSILWNNLSGAHFKSGDVAAAIDALHKSLALDPQYVTAHGNLGKILRSGKNLVASIESFNTALAIQPANWEYLHLLAQDHQDLGVQHAQAGRFDQADTQFQQALMIYGKLPAEAPYQRDLAGALNDLAISLREQGKLGQARALLERALARQHAALSLDPDDATSLGFLRNHYANLGDVLARLGDHVEVENVAREMATVFSQSAGGTYNAAALYSRCIRLVESDSTLSADKRSERATVYGDVALTLLRQSLKLGLRNPQHVLAHDHDLDPLRSRDEFTLLVTDLQTEDEQVSGQCTARQRRELEALTLSNIR